MIDYIDYIIYKVEKIVRKKKMDKIILAYKKNNGKGIQHAPSDSKIQMLTNNKRKSAKNG